MMHEYLNLNVCGELLNNLERAKSASKLKQEKIKEDIFDQIEKFVNRAEEDQTREEESKKL